MTNDRNDYMNVSFTKAQIERAKKCSFDKTIGVSVCFGHHSRFCAKLEMDRFGSLVVFITDAEQRDEVYPKINRIVWQSEPERLQEGVAFVLQKYPEPTVCL